MSQNQKKWTIGVVNFHSVVYLEYIAKALYKFNKPNDFKFIVVDNSRPHEKSLEDVLAPYKKKYNNVEIIYYNPTVHFPSGQHGEALNLILEKTNTPYLLVQDPDFFWVKKDYLNILEGYLNAGYVAIGAPYRTSKKITDGDSNFPAAFGCAYLMKALAGVDFYPSADVEEIKNLGRDVGWKIRKKLSKEKFFSFEQKQSKIYLDLGKFSYDVNPYEYYDKENKRISYHLFKGSRGYLIPKNVFKGYDGTNISTYDIHDTLNIGKIRRRYGKFFYNEAKYADSLIHKIVIFSKSKKVILKIFIVVKKCLTKLQVRTSNPRSYIKYKLSKIRNDKNL